MYYQLKKSVKYSSLLVLEKKSSSVLYLKGPLGKNIMYLPSNIKFSIDSLNNIIIFYQLKLGKNKKMQLQGYINVFYGSCRTLVFGNFIGLNIQGLGLKFLEVNTLLEKKCLSMSLGYSDDVNYLINNNHFHLIFKDIRNIYLYSTCYFSLHAEIGRLLILKRPNNFIKRENGMKVINYII